MSSLNKDHVEKRINEFIKEELDTPAERLLNFSLNLIERNKILNEDSHKLIEMQKNLKLKEINNSNKKMELLILEKRMNDKHGNKLNLKNILECYSIILKNNDELLKRRIEQLKERDFNLKKREFLLSKIRSNDFKLGFSFSGQNEKNSGLNDQQKEKLLDKNINEELIFEEIKNQFKLFQNAKMRNLSIDNLPSSQKKKLEVQKNEQIHISKSTSPKDRNYIKICSKNHNYRMDINERDNNDFNRITEENEDPLSSRRNSPYKKYRNSLDKSREKKNNFPDWSKEKDREAILLSKKNTHKNDNSSGTKKENKFSDLTSKDYKSDENEVNHNGNHSKEKGNIKLSQENKALDGQRNINFKNNYIDKKNTNKEKIKNNEKEVFSDTDKSYKITKLVKKKSSDDDSKSINNRSVRNKGIVKISSNFGKNEKSDDKYRGLARNLSGNKSFDNIRNASLGNSSSINKNDENNSNKFNQFNPENKGNHKMNNKNNNINKDILEKLLREAEEDAKKKENIKDISYNQVKKESKINQINNTSKNFNIDFNDENLLKISNILGNNKRIQNQTEENSIFNDNSTKDKQNHNLADGLFLLNQKGIFKNNKENLKIQSGLNLNLDQDIKKKNDSFNKANTDSNRREKSLAGNDKKLKDRLIYRDAEKDKENEMITKKAKRNTVFLGKDIEKKLDISNINQNNKDKPIKKNEMTKENSQLKDPVDNINYQNKKKISIYNNNSKQIKNDNRLNNMKQNEKDIHTRKQLESFNNNFSQDGNSNGTNPLIETYIKKLEFDNLNQSSNIVPKKGIKISNIKEQEINQLLESKYADGEKDNEMKVIIESEQILQDEIDIQKMTKYEEELLIKKPIQFNNELNLDDLKMNSLSVEKREKNSQRNSKIDKNDTKNNSKNSNFTRNQTGGNDEDSYEKRYSNRPDSLNINQENDNVIEYEKEFTKTDSQTNLDGSNILNSPIQDFTRGSFLDKKNTTLNNLKKNSFDSKDDSPNYSNNTNNKNKIDQTCDEKKYNKNDTNGNKNSHSSQKNNNINKRNSGKENSDIDKKKNLLINKDVDLTDSLDSSNKKNSHNKYRNSVDSKTISNRVTKIEVKNNNSSKGFNKDNNKNRSNTSNIKANEVKNRDKEESAKRETPQPNKLNNKDSLNNQNTEIKDAMNDKNIKDSSIQKNKGNIKEADIKIDQNPLVYKKTDSKEIKNSNSESRTKPNESNRNIYSDNTTNKDSTDNTISSTRHMDKFSIKMENSNLVSDINGKYDTCLDDDEDEEKIVDYQEYIKKMKQMAAETKMIEDNMRQFANIVQNMVENNKSDA